MIVLALLPSAEARAHRQPLPSKVTSQLPAGHRSLTFIPADFNADKRVDFVVVAHRSDESQIVTRGELAPKRPLLVYLQNAKSGFDLIGRNDLVVATADEGGQCDPFADGQGLAVKGRFFTVQNAVACGMHWTDYTTFKFSIPHGNFIFHRRILESWETNTSTDPNADALVLGSRKDIEGGKSKPVLLRDYVPE